jgi:cyclic pyranopterin phosphate synthase
MKLTHIDAKNNPTMVDVSDKEITLRSATAKSILVLPEIISKEINVDGELNLKKGPVFQTAIIAGTMAVKKTSDLIPFCHPLLITSTKIKINKISNSNLEIICTVKIEGKTGVEMEALMGASVAALTVYDMCKALSHEIRIESTQLVEKSGGKRDIKNGILCD